MTEVSTRAKSPKKPADHQPAESHKVSVKFRDEKYTFDARAFRDPRTLFLFKREDMEGALIRILGADDLERAIKSTEDEDGFADIERLGPIVELMAEAAGSKN